MNKDRYQKYLDYIVNVGASRPCKIEQFDVDFEPIGPFIRKEMREADLIFELDRENIFIYNEVLENRDGK